MPAWIFSYTRCTVAPGRLCKGGKEKCSYQCGHKRHVTGQNEFGRFAAVVVSRHSDVHHVLFAENKSALKSRTKRATVRIAACTYYWCLHRLCLTHSHGTNLARLEDFFGGIPGQQWYLETHLSRPTRNEASMCMPGNISLRGEQRCELISIASVSQKSSASLSFHLRQRC